MYCVWQYVQREQDLYFIIPSIHQVCKETQMLHVMWYDLGKPTIYMMSHTPILAEIIELVLKLLCFNSYTNFNNP